MKILFDNILKLYVRINCLFQLIIQQIVRRMQVSIFCSLFLIYSKQGRHLLTSVGHSGTIGPPEGADEQAQINPFLDAFPLTVSFTEKNSKIYRYMYIYLDSQSILGWLLAGQQPVDPNTITTLNRRQDCPCPQRIFQYLSWRGTSIAHHRIFHQRWNPHKNGL